jgi:hypothetical protein
VTIFGKFSGLTDVIKCANFRAIDQGVFFRRVPENRMLPCKSEVVLNTVLSANTLARDSWPKVLNEELPCQLPSVESPPVGQNPSHHKLPKSKRPVNRFEIANVED